MITTLGAPAFAAFACQSEPKELHGTATSSTTEASSSSGEPNTSSDTSEDGTSTVGESGATTSPDTTDTTDTTGFPAFDLAPPDVGEPMVCPTDCTATDPDGADGLWLLHVGNSKLWYVEVATGESTELCTLPEPYDEMAFVGLTMTRDNRLLAVPAMPEQRQPLYEINPCTCGVQELGLIPEAFLGVRGIAPDEDEGLFGLSGEADALVRIEVSDASATEVGPLGEGFSKLGLTWSEDENKLYAINAETDGLYKVDPVTGTATLEVTLQLDFTSIGVELHPADDTIYACTSDNMLYRVNRNTGQVEEIGGPVGDGTGACSNLGAPWEVGGKVCLPQQ